MGALVVHENQDNLESLYWTYRISKKYIDWKVKHTVFLIETGEWSSKDLKLMYLKRFWTGIVLGIVIVLNFESFFFALLASVSLGNKNGCKFQHYDYA